MILACRLHATVDYSYFKHIAPDRSNRIWCYHATLTTPGEGPCTLTITAEMQFGTAKACLT